MFGAFPEEEIDPYLMNVLEHDLDVYSSSEAQLAHFLFFDDDLSSDERERLRRHFEQMPGISVAFDDLITTKDAFLPESDCD